MFIEIRVPDIGTDEVEITEIMVRVGDKINIEQPLITIEGEKASMDVPSPLAGKIKEIKIKEGDKVETGSLIMIFEVDAITSMPINNTKINNDDTKITSKLITPTHSQSLELPSAVKINNDPKIKDAVLKKNIDSTHGHATPLIRRLAREFGVNVNNINGSGRKGRILREDIQAYIRLAVKNHEANINTSDNLLLNILPWPKIDFSKFGKIKEIELNRIQKISSANLNRNWVMIPHVTIMEEIDITALEDFRKQQNKEMEKLQTGVKITSLVFVMKAIARTLEEMPRFNSSIAKNTQRLILKNYIHIGVAVDTAKGLVVPVIRNVNKKGILELSKELIEVSQKARDGTLTISDMQGSSFTISNLGSIGTTSFTPIVNAPEVAIIGISRSSIKPVWNGSEFIARFILPISLSFDHSVIDGADGARFVTRIAQLISDVRRLIM